MRKTPDLFKASPPPAEEAPRRQPQERVKFYADAPDGTQNKLLVYKVHDLDHSIDLLNRFHGRGWKVRAAWHLFDNGHSVRLTYWKLEES